MVQMKVAQNLISFEKFSGNISLSNLGVEPGASTDLPVLKCYNTLQWESRFTLWLNAAKNLIISKNGSNEGCAKLNFLQKTLWKNYVEKLCGRISLSPPQGGGR